MSRDDALDRMLRKLNTLEPTILQLLSLNKQTAILEKKLNQVEDWVIEIPDDYGEFAFEWRKKLATWWRMYAECSIDSGPVAANALFRTTTNFEFSKNFVSQAIPSLAVKTPAFTGERQLSQFAKSLHGRLIIRNFPSQYQPTPVATFPFLTSPDPQYLPSANSLLQHHEDEHSQQAKSLSSSQLPAVGSSSSSSTISDAGGEEDTEDEYKVTFPTLDEAKKAPKRCASLEKIATAATTETIPTLLSQLTTTIDNLETASLVSQNTATKTNGDIELIRAELIKDFSDLSVIESGTDVEAIKALLRITVKAAKMITPVRYDWQLQLDIFDLAYGKLPEGKQREYDANYAQKTLYLMNGFLRNEIVTYYAETKRQTMNEAIAAGVLGPVSAVAVEDQPALMEIAYYCRYCKKNGHLIPSCPALKMVLCFKCNLFGHSAKKCPTNWAPRDN